MTQPFTVGGVIFSEGVIGAVLILDRNRVFHTNSVKTNSVFSECDWCNSHSRQKHHLFFLLFFVKNIQHYSNSADRGAKGPQLINLIIKTGIKSHRWVDEKGVNDTTLAHVEDPIMIKTTLGPRWHIGVSIYLNLFY